MGHSQKNRDCAIDAKIGDRDEIALVPCELSTDRKTDRCARIAEDCNTEGAQMRKTRY